MTFLGSLKELVHSITTPDHYASFDGDRPRGRDAVPLAPASGAGSLGSRQSSTVDLSQGYAHGNRSAQLNSRETDGIQMESYGPSPKVAWGRIYRWIEERYPELFDQIMDGATLNDIEEFEYDIDCTIPADVRESYALHDGQERGGKPTGLIFGIELMCLESVLEEWSIWRNAAIKYNELVRIKSAARRGWGEQKSVPKDAVQAVYSHPAWIPLAKDGGGNNISIDLNPGPKGRWGQVILFGRDFDTKYVIAPSWGAFLDMFANDLEHGRPFIDDDLEWPVFALRQSGALVPYFEILRKRAIDAQPKSAPSSPPLPRKSGASTPRLVSPAQSSTNLLRGIPPKEGKESIMRLEPKLDAKPGSSKSSTPELDKDTKSESDKADPKPDTKPDASKSDPESDTQQKSKPAESQPSQSDEPVDVAPTTSELEEKKDADAAVATFKEGESI